MLIVLDRSGWFSIKPCVFSGFCSDLSHPSLPSSNFPKGLISETLSALLSILLCSPVFSNKKFSCIKMASDPTQPVTLPDTDSIIWKAYGNVIKGLIAPGGSIGEDTFVYVCPPTQAGIAAGPWIFPAVTNNQIHHVADSLLTTDTPLFLPGGGSYFDALRT